MKYRDDIDGLRAVAVITVVLFHFQFGKWFSGGFVGVDIFFVISGYLITKLILDDVASGQYSVVNFYSRRSRRIFPALFAVLAAVLIVTFLTKFPYETLSLGPSIQSTIGFVSNIYFYSTTSYFNPALSNNPLLHTWSLSVEEQFYIFLPLLIFCIKGLDEKKRRVVLGLVALVSLSMSSRQIFVEKTAAFYLTHFRAWEFLVGSLIAVKALPSASSRMQATMFGAAGLIAISVTAIFYTKDTPFPGFSAILPCGGAALLILAGAYSGNPISTALAANPLRFIGRISYSLYLWHWPIIAFASQSAPLNTISKLGLFALSIGVSAASWKYIEQPFRRGGYSISVGKTLGASLGAAMCLVVLSAQLPRLSSFIWPLPAEAQQVLNLQSQIGSPSVYMRQGECFLTLKTGDTKLFQKDKCLALSPTKKNVLIIGDSHAAHLWFGYAHAFPQINFLQITASYCKPTLPLRGMSYCTDLMKYAFEQFLPSHHVDLIIYSARWSKNDVDRAIKTADLLKKYTDRVVVVGPIQIYRHDLPDILLSALAHSSDPEIASAKERSPEQAITDGLFRSKSLPSGVTYLSTYSILCGSTCTLWTRPGIPLQIDDGHLTKPGSIYFAETTARKILGNLLDDASASSAQIP